MIEAIAIIDNIWRKYREKREVAGQKTGERIRWERKAWLLVFSHDFVAGTDFLHFLPDFDPYIIAGFQLHHLYIGILVMLIGLAIAVKYDE